MKKKFGHAAKLESLGVLAGGIAHDFNNLLTGILGNASLLKEMVPAASSTGLAAQRDSGASERAAQLSRQMLAYSGRGQFTVQPIDLSRQVREFVSFIETTVSKNVAIRLRIAESLSMVEGDEGQLQQVIMNLVVNAAEAIGERDGWVEVSTRVENASTTPLVSDLLPSQELPAGLCMSIVLQVADNGSGMDDATRAKIFEPFFTTKFTGRGLGLAAVLGIIRGHRGHHPCEFAFGRGHLLPGLLPLRPPAPWNGRSLLPLERQHPRVRDGPRLLTMRKSSGWRPGPSLRTSGTPFSKVKTGERHFACMNATWERSRSCCST